MMIKYFSIHKKFLQSWKQMKIHDSKESHHHKIQIEKKKLKIVADLFKLDY